MSATNHPGPMTVKNFMSLEAHGVQPSYGFPLAIISAASPRFLFNAINIYCASATEGQPLILWSLPPGPVPWENVWSLTPEGLIVCPRYPEFVVGISDGNLCLASRSDTSASLLWTLSPYPGGYAIINKQTSQAITASAQSYLSGGQILNGSLTLSPISGNSPEPDQLWTFIPPGTIPVNSFYIQSAMSGKPGTVNTPLMVTYSSDSAIYAQNWSPGSTSQLWRFNSDGTIATANDIAESLVLTSLSTGSKTTEAVALQPVVNTPTDLQQWSYQESNNYLTVTSQATGTISLNVNDNKSGNALITYAEGGSNSEWYIFPEQSTLPGQWFYVQTMVNQAADNPPGGAYVVTLADTDPVAGTSIQINQLQPGALTQLWQLTPQGNLVSAADQTLILSAPTDNGGGVSVQTQGTANFLQYWCIMPNGMLATLNGTTTYYLSVPSSLNPYATTSNGNNPMVNAAILVYSQSVAGQAMAMFEILPYEPELSGQWFTIESVNENEKDSSPFLLSAGNDWSTVELLPPLGNNILQYGTAGLNQLWRFNLNGEIISALNPQLYLTGIGNGGSDGAAVGLARSGAPAQHWAWGETWKTSHKFKGKPFTIQSAVLLNTSLNYALYAQENGCVSQVSLQAIPASSVPNQWWYMVPVSPAFDQPTTIRNQGGTGKIPNLFLHIQPTVQNKITTYPIIVGPRSGASDLSTWQFIYPGYIASSVNENIVLSLEGVPGSASGATVYGPTVAAYPRLIGEQAFQLWEADQQGVLINRQNGQALMVVVDDSVSPTTYSLTTLPLSQQSANNLPFWDFTPGLALQTTLIMPPIPFPLPDQGSMEQQYYNQICNSLGLSAGLREQYQNLAAPLASYQIEMSMLPVPIDSTTNEPAVAWVNVVSQLNREITQVISVQQFFTQLTSFHQGLSQAQALLVSELITACAFPNGQATPVVPPKKKKAWIWNLVEGILYTGLNIAGTFVGDPDAGKETSMLVGALKVNALPVLANSLSCALSTTQSYKQSSPSSNSQISKALQNAYNYELTVYQLQQSLLNLFENIGEMLGRMEMTILMDWGKINAVNAMIKNTSTIDSLFWPASMSPVMTQQMLSGYATTVLQTLIPANPNFYINANLHDSNTSQEGLQLDQATYYGPNLDNTASQWVAVINPDVMNQVWGYGTYPEDFYRQLNGWNILAKYPVGTQYASLIMNFYNETSVPMSLHLAQMTLCLNNPTTLELPPYSMGQFAGHAANEPFNVQGPSGLIRVFEKNPGPGGTSILVLEDTVTQYPCNSGQMPSYSTNLQFYSPYFLAKSSKNPTFAENMNIYNIYIGMNPTL